MLIASGDSLEQVWASVQSELHRATKDKKHPFRFVVFSTGAGGRVSSRYVVLRYIDEQLNFFFYTDDRTPKVEEMGINDEVALLFYHPRKRVQVRISGTATTHQGDSIWESFKDRIQGDAAKAYSSLAIPGKVIPSPEEGHQWSEDSKRQHFLVIQVTPLEIDILQLNGMEHYRAGFTKNKGHWPGHWLAP